MRRFSKLIQDLKFKQIQEVVVQSQSMKPVKISESTKKILQKYFGKKWSDQYLIEQGSYKLQGYYCPSLKLAIGEEEFQGGGCYGNYYKISSTQGIKIMDNDFSTLSGLKNSQVWIDAYREFFVQKKAAKANSFVPKAYKVLYLYDMKSGYWKVGILMEHVNAKTGYDLPLVFARAKKFKLGKKIIYCKSVDQLENEIKKELKSSGIMHRDVHCNNILIKNKDIKVIDFGKAHLIKKAV